MYDRHVSFQYAGSPLCTHPAYRKVGRRVDISACASLSPAPGIFLASD